MHPKKLDSKQSTPIQSNMVMGSFFFFTHHLLIQLELFLLLVANLSHECVWDRTIFYRFKRLRHRNLPQENELLMESLIS